VFIAMATSSVSFVKLLGVGLTLAILFDATLIRAILMPAAMRLMGRANWWAPHWRRPPAHLLVSDAHRRHQLTVRQLTAQLAAN
jgi:RND superfamily putative drug exporter